MLVGALLAMMGALWFVLRPAVALSTGRMLWSFGLIVGGAVGVVVAVVIGGFATGWTFLYPLPFLAAGQWSEWATVAFLVGMVLVGVGFFVYCLDVFTATTSTYGGLVRTLGIPFLRGRDDDPPPPQAIAATVVSLEGLLASAVGTTILLALLGRVLDDGVQIDALWAKNLTYFFGHTVANLIIYLAAGALYVLVPRYAGRPWKTTKPLVVGWMATLIIVATAYSHHLYMDFVQPRFAAYVSTTASFAAALPVAVVTIYTAMMLVWGSRYRWTLASTLLYLGFAGWAIGGTGAVIDSLIPINFRFHNTLWVPAHFHTYLLLGVILWAMAFVVHLAEEAAGRPSSRLAAWVAPVAMVVGGYGLVGAWYASGALGEPRRYAVHFPGSDGYSVAGSIFAVIFAVGFLVLLVEVAALVRHARARRVPTASAQEPTRPGSVPVPSPAIDSPVQVAVAATVATVALVSLFPTTIDLADANARYHHLDHAAQFLLGAVIGFVFASTRLRSGRRPTGGSALAWVVVIAAPAAMLLAMVPGVYAGLEDHGFLHFLYHLGIVVLGTLTGAAAATFGKVAGRALLVLSVAMALMYAAGVTGG